MSDQRKALKLAHSKLDPNNTQAGLPGREQQYQEIYDFLHDRLKKRISNNKLEISSRHTNKTMFICGVPGTGKTATVMKVIADLQDLLSDRKVAIHKFKHIYINSQFLSSPQKIYSEILKELTGQTLSKDSAQEKLDTIFQRESSHFTVITIDELDLLYSAGRQQIFYSLFDWPTSSETKVILIAIANAMDLPERFMRGRVTSRVGCNNLMFESYTSSCLENIIKTRLDTELMKKVFVPAAIGVATKRVGKTTGDARRILDTCRLAIERALEINATKVTPDIIDSIGFQNLDKQRINVVRRCHPLQMMILQSIVAKMRDLGEENVTTYVVYRHLCYLMSISPKYKKHVIGLAKFEDFIRLLATSSVIHLDLDKPMHKQHIYLKDNNDTIVRVTKEASGAS